MEKRTKTFPVCVQAYGSLCYRWFLILLGDGLNVRNIFDYEDKGVGFNICEYLKITLN